MDKQRCENCGTELNECPNCKQKLKERKTLYEPEQFMMARLQRPTKRGKIEWHQR